MNSLHRRYIAMAFIALFFLFSPFLLLYASGYRYNFKKKLIQRTGAINLDVIPESANIYLNEQLQKRTAPAIITNLLPQEYSLALKKTGYRDWQGSVEVMAAQTNFIGPVYLFKSEISPVYIADLPANIKAKQQATSTSYEIFGFDINLIPDNKSYSLQSRFSLNHNTSSLATLPISDYLFITAPTEWLSVRDTRNSILYLFEFKSGSVTTQHVIANVSDYDWHFKSRRLVYSNDFELWVFDLTTGQKQLLTRLSDGIAKPVWHSSGKYVIYLNDNSLKLIETNNSSQRQNIDLLSLPLITDLVSSEADTLYINATINNQKGWFELTLQ